MMSGQILAGQSPQQAAVYQILINLLIATNALLTVQLVINSSIQVLVNTRESRIRHGILVPKEKATTMIPSLVSIFSKFNLRKILHSSVLAKQIGIHPSTCTSKNLSSVSTKINSNTNYEIPVLKIKHLEVKRANVKVHLTLCSGDRLAITGPSGCGKSQILRTMVGLEELEGNSFISLSGESLCQNDLPRFRSKVCLVPQNKPTLEGTPNGLYKQSIRYRCRCRRNQENLYTRTVPSEIARNWNIGVEAFDQPWSTLSGGESQKAALAIAISLEPDVLLLDESTSALDELSSLPVEETLKACTIPMIIVTHSNDQLERFCTDRLDLH
jgi:ABC-type iron transport system FetAB ATPase subunit